MLQKKYQTEESALINYSYADIADGTGIQNFYAVQMTLSGSAVTGVLTPDAGVFSGNITEKTIYGTATYAEKDDTDYDVTFNVPKTINGTIVVNVTQGLNVEGAGNGIYLLLSLYKVSGGTPTQIGSTVTTEAFETDVITIQSKTTSASIATGGNIDFKAGDILRLNIVQWSKGAGATATQGYGVDPADRNDIAEGTASHPELKILEDADTSQLKVAVPFVLDI